MFRMNGKNWNATIGLLVILTLMLSLVSTTTGPSMIEVWSVVIAFLHHLASLPCIHICIATVDTEILHVRT